MANSENEDAPRSVVPQPPLVSNYGLVLTVYILYLVGFLTAITTLVGVIIAYLQRGKTDQVCESHFPSFHDAPPVPSKHLTRCLRNRVQATTRLFP